MTTWGGGISETGGGRARGAARRAASLVRLMRPGNVLLVGLGVGVGAVLGGAVLPAAEGGRLVGGAVAAAALVAAGANAHNDACDAAADRVNRPGRPIPAGHCTERQARRLGLMAMAAGVTLATLLAPRLGLMALGVASLVYAYNRYLKALPVVGNVAVGSAVALTLCFGAAAAGRVAAALPAAAFAFLTTWAREVAKDVEDLPGDAAAGLRTLPRVAGAVRAARLGAGLALLTLLLVPLPYALLGYSGLYLLLSLGAAALLGAAAAVLLQPPTPPRAAQASRLLKQAMVAGLAALLLA